MISSLEQAVKECIPEVEVLKVNESSVLFSAIVRGERKKCKISKSYRSSVPNGRTSKLSYDALILTLFVDGSYWMSKEASSFNLEHSIPAFVRSIA